MELFSVSNPVITIVVGIVGVISTIVAWKFNPKRQREDEIDRIDRELERLDEKQAKALALNDSSLSTIILTDIKRLQNRRITLLQRQRFG